MDAIVGVGIAMLVGAALVLGIPMSVMILWARTRELRTRVDALTEEVQDLRLRLRSVPGVRTLRDAEPSAPAPVTAVAEAPTAAVVPPIPAPEAAPATPPPVVAVPEPVIATGVQAAPSPQHRARPLRADDIPERQVESLETAIGARWLLYIGVVAIVIGVAYFEKLAIDRGWISPAARVIQGAFTGLALMFAGTRFVKRRYTGYGEIIMGGGGAILFVSAFAAFNYYSLIARPTAFVLMVAITVLVAWLADRYRSQGLAVFAVGGGFVTPFLLPGNTDAQIALFTYDAILIAATAALSRRRDWPMLHLVSYVMTLMTVVGWADRFYTEAKYLPTEIYLTLYCGMFLYILRECRRHTGDVAKLVALMLWTAPAAYYVGSLVILVPHDIALMVWLVALMLAGGVAAARLSARAGLLTWLAVAVPLVAWCVTPDAPAFRQEGLITLAAVYVIALLAQLEGTVFRDEPRALAAADIIWVHLNPLAMYAGAYILISPISLVNAGYLAAAFGIAQAAIAAGLWRRRTDLAVHFLAVGFTLGAIAIALIFNGTAITAGWAVEGALVIALAQRQRLTWMRVAGVGLFAVAVWQVLLLLSATAPASHVIVFNPRAACAALVIGICYALAWLDSRDPEILHRDMGMAAALLTAQLVTLVLLTSEINAFWAVRDGRLQRELMLSVTWGLYATALVVIGLARDYAPIRYFAILVLGITITKVFLFDMAELDRIYRVGSIIVLGILLLVTSYLYTRARRAKPDGPAA